MTIFCALIVNNARISMEEIAEALNIDRVSAFKENGTHSETQLGYRICPKKKKQIGLQPFVQMPEKRCFFESFGNWR